MKSPRFLHLLRHLQKILKEVYHLILANPLIIPMFGLVQLSVFKYWPYEWWHEPFPFFELASVKENPQGVIHSWAYGADVHEYVMLGCVWWFCLISTKFKWQMKFWIFLEFLDLLDYVLRYNQATLTGSDAIVMSFTDIKKLFYALTIIITWIQTRMSSD